MALPDRLHDTYYAARIHLINRTFDVDLRPAASWHCCCHYKLESRQRVRLARRGCYGAHGETEVAEGDGAEELV